MAGYAVRPDITQSERARVESLISDLIREYQQAGRGASCITLPRELRRDLETSNYEWLAQKTCERLSRWCDTRRWARREQFVEPRAKEISNLLFGRVIPRDGC